MLVAGLVCALASGCVGYRLGPTNGLIAGAQSMQIVPFRNETIEPRLGDAVTAAVRRNIQQDGTYRLSTRGHPDVVVHGTITRFRRSEISFQPDDILTVRDYNLVVFARVIARDRASDRVLVDREVSGWTMIRVGSDLVSAERQALPVLADDLARNITHALVDGEW